MKDGWEIKPLREIAILHPPKKLAKNLLSEEDDVSFVPMKCLQIGNSKIGKHDFQKLGKVYSRYKYFADGDILLAKIGSCFENGKLGIANGLKNSVGFGSSEFFVIRPKSNVDPLYLYYLLDQQSFRDSGSRTMSGSVLKRVPKEFLESLPIPLAPLEEQQRIVAILDEAFKRLDQVQTNAEANLASTKELEQDTLEKIFVEGNWASGELQEFTHKDCSLSYGIVQPGEDVIDGLPIVRPTDLHKKVVGLEGLKRIDQSRANSYTRTRLIGGELLLCVRGSTGTIAIAADELTGANVSRGIAPIRFNETKVIQQFGFYQFFSNLIQNQITKKTYGMALMQINIRDIRKLRFLCPPIKKQREIIDHINPLIENHEHLKRSYTSRIHGLFDLRQSFLQKAFAGELT